jgi:hypothetical protein
MAPARKRKPARDFSRRAHVFRAIATTGTSAVSSFVAIDSVYIGRNIDRSMTEKPA